MANGLSPKQEAFVVSYIGPARFNATKAALMAGYTGKNARAEGSRLLANADIAARVKVELQRLTIPAEAVLAELTDVATAEWRDFVEILMTDDDGQPLRIRFDLRSKVNALELLGKHYKLFTDRIEHGADESFLAALKAFADGNAGA